MTQAIYLCLIKRAVFFVTKITFECSHMLIKKTGILYSALKCVFEQMIAFSAETTAYSDVLDTRAHAQILICSFKYIYANHIHFLVCKQNLCDLINVKNKIKFLLH